MGNSTKREHPTYKTWSDKPAPAEVTRMSKLSAKELRQIIIDNTIFLEDFDDESMMFLPEAVVQKVHGAIDELYLALEESSARGVKIPELEK